jgi:hypothetical protein
VRARLPNLSMAGKILVVFSVKTKKVTSTRRGRFTVAEQVPEMDRSCLEAVQRAATLLTSTSNRGGNCSGDDTSDVIVIKN